MSEFIEQFKDKADILEQFEIPPSELEGCKILLAWYGYGDYSGHALVVFEKDGKLFEVNASHCSCYGLEDQWDPEETSWEALHMRQIRSDYEGEESATTQLRALAEAHLAQTEEK